LLDATSSLRDQAAEFLRDTRWRKKRRGLARNHDDIQA
jgi:hypothetical protein